MTLYTQKFEGHHHLLRDIIISVLYDHLQLVVRQTWIVFKTLCLRQQGGSSYIFSWKSFDVELKHNLINECMWLLKKD